MSNLDETTSGCVATGGQPGRVLASGAVAIVVWLVWSLTAGGCSFIRFEKGPYVVRDLRVVYSQQEDMTFLAWKLRRDADLDLVHFELSRKGRYRRIDLSSAPFPASPWECGSNSYCFQYQIPGRYTPPQGGAPLRSRHDARGVFSGPERGVREVETTFDIDPFALGRNREIDPGLGDWFAQNKIPMKRSWQWQFTPRSEEDCSEPETGEWSRMGDRVSVDYGWVEEPSCFAARPDRRDAPGTEVAVPLPPSAETVAGEQTYAPRKIEAPIVWGVLFDTSIASGQRCEKVKQTIVSTLDKTIAKQGEHQQLGVYTPISRQTGESLSGCNQKPRREYPLAKMIREADAAQGRIAPQEVRILWIYVNNISIRPRQEIVDQIRRWTRKLPEQNQLPVYNWAVASNPILNIRSGQSASGGVWDQVTGWRPIEDDTLTADLVSVVENTLPFTTMAHSDDDEIPIEKPEGVDEPVAFKVCQSTPVPIEGIGIESDQLAYDFSDPAVPWPDRGRPFFRVAFAPQELVPQNEYAKRRVDLVVEVCERFCDHRFRSRGGGEYEQWNDTPGPRPMEVCQWRK